MNKILAFWHRWRDRLERGDPGSAETLTRAERMLLECRAAQLLEAHKGREVSLSLIDGWHEPHSEPVVIGIDWAHAGDIAAYTCGACHFETGFVDVMVQHVKAHGATRVTVIPADRPAYPQFQP
jgi:hypothetical protein